MSFPRPELIFAAIRALPLPGSPRLRLFYSLLKRAQRAAWNGLAASCGDGS